MKRITVELFVEDVVRVAEAILDAAHYDNEGGHPDEAARRAMLASIFFEAAGDERRTGEALGLAKGYAMLANEWKQRLD